VDFALALSSTSPSIDEAEKLQELKWQPQLNSARQCTSELLNYLEQAVINLRLISSTGVITTLMPMDYETTNSYSLTVTVTDGTNTDTETINISVNNLTLNTLATTLANSGAALAESSSSGTAVASSSVNNPDSETITYT
jgi:hypothetical protein